MNKTWSTVCNSFYVCSFSQTISEWNYQFWFTVIQEDEKKKSDGGAGEGGAGEDPPKKKYEQMPKWQKWSYILSVIMMGGLTIANGVLFCKFELCMYFFNKLIHPLRSCAILNFKVVLKSKIDNLMPLLTKIWS